MQAVSLPPPLQGQCRWLGFCASSACANPPMRCMYWRYFLMGTILEPPRAGPCWLSATAWPFVEPNEPNPSAAAMAASSSSASPSAALGCWAASEPAAADADDADVEEEAPAEAD